MDMYDEMAKALMGRRAKTKPAVAGLGGPWQTPNLNKGPAPTPTPKPKSFNPSEHRPFVPRGKK